MEKSAVALGRKRRAELAIEQMRDEMLLPSTPIARMRIAHRDLVVDLIAEICDEFSLQTQTAHLSISYFDRFMSRSRQESVDLRLVSIVCVVLACKFFETKVPALKDLTDTFTEQKYTRAQLKIAELNVLTELDWKLHHATPHAFLEKMCELRDTLSQACQRRAAFLIDMSYWESALLEFSPCIIAGAAFLCAVEMIEEGARVLDDEVEALCRICAVERASMEGCKKCLYWQFRNSYEGVRSESPNDVMDTLDPDAPTKEPAHSDGRAPPSKNHFSPLHWVPTGTGNTPSRSASRNFH